MRLTRFPRHPALRRVRLASETFRSLPGIFLFLCLAAATLQADWSLGPVTMTRVSATPPLLRSATRASFATTSFLENVGGVAFIETAAPGPSTAGRSVRLRYDAAQPDGQRLGVTIGGETYRPAIPDWQLVPIAKLAASDNNALFSLFGENGTEDVYDARFHPALNNTLLGMRLLQADMMWMLGEHVAELPRRGGTLVLGAGERLPHRAPALRAAAMLGMLMQDDFQSWVLTDRGENIRFETVAGRLVISGDPYYYFWRYTAVKDTVEAVAARYEANVDTAIALARGELTTVAQRRLARLGTAIRRDSLRLVSLVNDFERHGTEPLTAMNAALRQQSVAVRTMNPAVYDAASNTLRYTAFFRWVRANHPDGWQRFLAQVRSVSPQPAVVTPNRVPSLR